MAAQSTRADGPWIDCTRTVGPHADYDCGYGYRVPRTARSEAIETATASYAAHDVAQFCGHESQRAQSAAEGAQRVNRRVLRQGVIDRACGDVPKPTRVRTCSAGVGRRRTGREWAVGERGGQPHSSTRLWRLGKRLHLVDWWAAARNGWTACSLPIGSAASARWVCGSRSLWEHRRPQPVQ